MSWSHGALLWSIWHMLPEGVDRREGIPTGPKARDMEKGCARAHVQRCLTNDFHTTHSYCVPTIPGIPTTHDKGGYDMQQWNAAVASGLVAGVAMCNFFRTSEIMFLYLKLVSGENKSLIVTFGNSKYSELKWKIKITGITWVRKMLQF